MATKFRTRFTRVRSSLAFKDPSLAQQQFKDEVDINHLLKRFGVTGQLPVGVRVPQYGDFTEIKDYRSAMDIVLQARDEFMKLPAEVRARFGHSPQAFMEFGTDPANLEEMRKMGLAPIPAPKEPSTTPTKE